MKHGRARRSILLSVAVLGLLSVLDLPGIAVRGRERKQPCATRTAFVADKTDGSGLERTYAVSLGQTLRRPCAVEVSTSLMTAVLSGFALALLLAVPALSLGPVVTLPISIPILFGIMSVLRGCQSQVLAMCAIVMGVPVAMSVLFLPSNLLLYISPGLVGCATGLCTSLLLGGPLAFECGLVPATVILGLYALAVFRNLSLGGWD
mmetsp:Transcript_4402/g.9586  ORF Transcript_4402/g.9586 Transcript_4402/m.9586 type:complete len:206 (+) Transcript_4402:101-718(+)